MDPTSGRALIGAAVVAKQGSKLVVVFNFILNMVVSGAIQEMLSAMKKM